MQEKIKYKRLGEILIEEGILTKRDLVTAMNLQQNVRKPLGEILVEYNFATWEQIAEALSKQYNLPLLREPPKNIEPDVLSMLPQTLVEKYRIIPISVDKSKGRITIATDNVVNFGRIIQEVRFATGLEVDIVLMPKDIFELTYDEYFRSGINKEIVEELRIDLSAEEVEETEETEELEAAPVVRLVNTLIEGAIRDQASDIHIEPADKSVTVRYRIDGILRKVTSYPKHSHNAVVSRIKILSNLDISERRIPQDGKFFVKFEEEQYDLRVSTMPTIYGEKVVMRILRVSASQKKIEDLGFTDYNRKRLMYLLDHPYGIILVTGPTGSGKSTTLVAILNELKDVTKNIITIEDPVEYSIEGVNQSQANPDIGLTFARMLRSVLRQDPDIIMVGEIRDKETAQLAIEASMTGHLVFSTLHTNNAPSAVSRLVNLGIDPYLITTSLIGVIAQRLVRTLCNECKQKKPLRDEYFDLVDKLYPELEKVEYVPVGCSACKKSGFKGRTAIHEVMIVDEKLKQLIVSGGSKIEIEKLARSNGMRTLFEDGFEKVLKGITSLDEVKRVAAEE
ncbi:MAG: type pilus assembly protein PilB [Thermotogaceae bacterium]|jgi:type IV pilus assembly protein PilB|nr:type pilus assembly protein PilB [Thermotogaceae bacterium]MDN5336974.1 type pilus assembly protein PilB [Thermotogaceae bacterium]